ncbi:Hypothetical_protein [Hexamita inflata]|uniref:Hypothetical_protein n=1 Tax=Hexamita inflata TaxID=28002 RepID=A0AA86PHX9_9EUKA|nr:Hypothetical protein HINF_LOCUS23244 [Hexamita inflata]
MQSSSVSKSNKIYETQQSTVSLLELQFRQAIELSHQKPVPKVKTVPFRIPIFDKQINNLLAKPKPKHDVIKPPKVNPPSPGRYQHPPQFPRTKYALPFKTQTDRASSTDKNETPGPAAYQLMDKKIPGYNKCAHRKTVSWIYLDKKQPEIGKYFTDEYQHQTRSLSSKGHQIKNIVEVKELKGDAAHDYFWKAITGGIEHKRGQSGKK